METQVVVNSFIRRNLDENLIAKSTFLRGHARCICFLAVKWMLKASPIGLIMKGKSFETSFRMPPTRRLGST